MNANNDPEIAALAHVGLEEVYPQDLAAFYDDLNAAWEADLAVGDELAGRREMDCLDYRAELIERD